MFTSFAKAVDTGIFPDVGPIASRFTKPEIVDVRRATLFENKYQLVAGAIECTHAAIGFGPYDKIFKLVIDGFPGGLQLDHVPPVHAYEMNRTVTGRVSHVGKRIC